MGLDHPLSDSPELWVGARPARLLGVTVVQMSKPPQNSSTVPIPCRCSWAEAATGAGIIPFAPKWLFPGGQLSVESP